MTDTAHLHKSLKSIALRKTSSNPVVGNKKASSVNTAKKRAVVKGTAEEVVDEPKDAHLQAIGGLSDDDDTLEREAAISSPLKGTDSRGNAKVSSQPSNS